MGHYFLDTQYLGRDVASGIFWRSDPDPVYSRRSDLDLSQIRAAFYPKMYVFVFPARSDRYAIKREANLTHTKRTLKTNAFARNSLCVPETFKWIPTRRGDPETKSEGVPRGVRILFGLRSISGVLACVGLTLGPEKKLHIITMDVGGGFIYE